MSSSNNSIEKDQPSKDKWDLNNVIMVWNTPWTVHENEVLKAFDQCGKSNIAKNWTPIKGITLIQFQNESEVEKALSLHRKEYMGRKLFIKKIGGNTQEIKTVLAWNIPLELEFNKQKLKIFFEEYGKVVDIRLNRNFKKEFSGTAFIEFASQEDMLNVFKLHNKKFMGKNIQLEIAKNKAKNY